MSRFGDEYEADSNNQADLWYANVKKALAGKRGKKALAEMREALLALPEKRLIAGALCTVGADRVPSDEWARQDYEAKLKSEGEGVCAIGAFLWFKKVKAGTDPQTAFEELPTLLDSEGDGGMETAEAGKAAGLTWTLAWELAYRNDEVFYERTPEERYQAFMRWLDEQLSEQVAA